jgi:hypothetical protein
MLNPNKIYDYLSKIKLSDFSNKRPIRIGSYNDGGYLLLDHLLEKTDVLYSYGIADNTTFETEFCYRYQCSARLYDHTINRLPYCLPTFKFHKEGIGASKTHELNTLMSHIQQNNDTNKNMVLKMDVEGAEYEALLATPNHVLQQFSQIAIELHGIDNIESEQEYQLRCNFFDKMNKIFFLYHAHYNNYDHTIVKYGYNIPQTIEVTFVNRNLKDLTPIKHVQALPRAKDRHCKPNRMTHNLAYWPFDQRDFIHNSTLPKRYIKPSFLSRKLHRYAHKMVEYYYIIKLLSRRKSNHSS